APFSTYVQTSTVAGMCGIAGLYTKTPGLQAQLGDYLSRMLEQLSFRGPDSAGVAFYRDPAPAGATKVSLYSSDPELDWSTLGAELEAVFGDASAPHVRATHAVFVVGADAIDVQAWLAEHHPELR